MFKTYGIIGLLLIAIVELNFIFKIQPLADWYFPIVWFGFILVIDALIYKLRKHSPLMNRSIELLLIFVLSIPFWYIFEIFNIFVKNWMYNPQFTSLIRLVSAAFLFPAVYEVYHLLKTLHLFDKYKLHKTHNIKKSTLYFLVILGIVCFILPSLYPKYTFPLIWLSLFFILDPINYLHNEPSLIRHIKNRNLKVPVALGFAGLIVGFFWEFWNYWAIPKWFYTFGYFYYWKVFEMPILGYLGYIGFAFELYAMYWFARSLFRTKSHLLSKSD